MKLFLFVTLLLFEICGCSTYQKFTGEESSSYFGISVSTTDHFAFIGASYYDNQQENSGICYAYKFENGRWEKYSELSPSKIERYALFGGSVAIDNDKVVVGKSGDGKILGGAVVFVKNDQNNWVEEKLLEASDGSIDDRFGFSVAINQNWVVVGAPNENTKRGAVYTYLFEESTWTETQKFTKLDKIGEERQEKDYFGSSVSISGDYFSVGVYSDDDNGMDSGAVFIYKLNSTNHWNFHTKLSKAETGYFGWNVAMKDDRLIVGARGTNSAFSNVGTVYIYKLNGENWELEQELIPPTQDQKQHYNYGWSVDISSSHAIVGSSYDTESNTYGGEVAYLYNFSEIEKKFVLSTKLTGQRSQSDHRDLFGNAVSLSNNHVLIGAYKDFSNGNYSGSAYFNSLCSEAICYNYGKPTFDCSTCVCENSWLPESNCQECGLICEQGTTNANCTACEGTEIFCFGIESNNINACSSNGKCQKYNTCECIDNYGTENCSKWLCDDLPEDADYYYGPKCSIVCKDGWKIAVGGICQSVILVLSVTGIIFFSGVSIFVVIITLLIIFVVIIVQKLFKYRNIKDIDIIVAEQEMENQGTIAKVKVNERIFQVDISEIKIQKKIGEGGSSASIFLAEYHNTKVAFKCFNTEMLGSNNHFSEFEKEVAILAGVKFPFILKYLGATLSPPRVGIIMEYCPNGDLKEFLMRKENRSISLKKKLQFLLEICSSMEYLHSKNILHRDLKPDNILLTENLETRLMDFGMSKFIENSEKTMTKRIGTSKYIAPEVIVGKYDKKADVFSASIMMWEILTSNFNPYEQKITQGIENKVANDPKFRPSLKEKIFEENDWILSMLKKCWSKDKSERLDFESIVQILTTKKGKKIKKETN